MVVAFDSATKVLVVDDSRTILKIIRGLLNQTHILDIDEAVDGSDALVRLEKSSYDLVISDWNMKPMNGLELLNRMREDPLLERIPFIMITAENKMGSVVVAKQAGVSDYIVKPFSAEILRGKIERVLSTAS